MKLPQDKNGREIQPGNTIRMVFNVRQRERPGARRVAIEGMSGQEVIVNDEGSLGSPIPHWVDFVVDWDGACLVAKRVSMSDSQIIRTGECTSIMTGKRIDTSSAIHYLNTAFNSGDFQVR
jgi:hypothetical protein